MGAMMSGGMRRTDVSSGDLDPTFKDRDYSEGERLEAPTGAYGVPFSQPFKVFREQWIDNGEREYLRRLLERHQRNVSAAARAAELDRTYLYRLIRKHGL
jgi:transcriptional regulator of acetoin/glycerol metabolism